MAAMPRTGKHATFLKGVGLRLRLEHEVVEDNTLPGGLAK